jgi:hypothetical protein
MIGPIWRNRIHIVAAKKTFVAGALFRAVHNPRLLEIVVGDGNDHRRASSGDSPKDAGDIRLVSGALLPVEAGPTRGAIYVEYSD